ncbi:MAG: hypothetical protein HY317_01660 [Acidobacteria bacterium]|nr:hypothetical protein [Acidobacteriota bacterium]
MVARVAGHAKRRLHDLPSVTLASLAGILARAGHDVRFTRGELADGDVALALSSIVDHRNETHWADAMRARGARVGFVGIAASKLPDLFLPHADFVVQGEPEDAVARLSRGERLEGLVASREAEPEALPFPRWDLVGAARARRLPLLATRTCSEFCEACPNRIFSRPRHRSVAHVLEELAALSRSHRGAVVVLRDHAFARDRSRLAELARVLALRPLSLRFEWEARLRDVDAALLGAWRAAGLQALRFRVGAGGSDAAAARAVVDDCRRLGVKTVALCVLGRPEDTWDAVAARIDETIALGTTLAQFKLLTPYPGTPLWRQLGGLVYETDWERFDSFTPTFRHPHLAEAELRFLLRAAYARFYLRPSFLANLGALQGRWTRGVLGRLDAAVASVHARRERGTKQAVVT